MLGRDPTATAPTEAGPTEAGPTEADPTGVERVTVVYRRTVAGVNGCSDARIFGWVGTACPDWIGEMDWNGRMECRQCSPPVQVVSADSKCGQSVWSVVQGWIEQGELDRTDEVSIRVDRI